MEPINPYLGRRLARAAKSNIPRKRRFIIDRIGQSSSIASTGEMDRLHTYLQRRQQTVARILVLGEKIRNFKNQEITSITHTGAFWQTYTGINEKEDPRKPLLVACHTSPCLLLLNGHLPHVPVKPNVPLEQQIILTFADVMLMSPRINQVDGIFDDWIGSKDALVQAMQGIIKAGIGYREALDYYRKRRSEGIEALRQTTYDWPSNELDFREDLIEFRELARMYHNTERSEPHYPEIENFKRQVENKIAGISQRL